MNKILVTAGVIVVVVVGAFVISAKRGFSPSYSTLPPGRSVSPRPTASFKVPAVSLNQLTPAAGKVGTQITIKGSGFVAQGNTVKFTSADGTTGYIKGLNSADGTTLVFTVPDGLDLCAPNSTQQCPDAYPAVRPGAYTLSVMNQNGLSNALPFAVSGY